LCNLKDSLVEVIAHQGQSTVYVHWSIVPSWQISEFLHTLSLLPCPFE
jgi:hypothetical protein